MSRTLRTFVAIGVTVFALAWSESRARADESAQAFIQSRQNEVTALLHQAGSAQRDRKISAVLSVMIDFDELAKRSLAAHWSDLSEDKRKEFTDVLRRLVQRSYERNIRNILDYRIEYLGEETADTEESKVVVHTQASSKTNDREDPVTIDYRMMPAGESWRVVDIVTEGASLVNNYRNQFNRTIKKDGVDALLKRMKDRLAKGEQV
jgi:phospholipid transport system substrate-binding protein